MQRKNDKKNTKYDSKEEWLETKNIGLNKDDFTLFRDPKTRRKVHQINWFVYRDQSIRDILNGYVDTPILHKRINVLFRNMEIDGPYRSEFDKYQHDKVSDMYHCHPVEGKTTYVVMWEVDVERRIINIVAMDTHENFNFRPKHNREAALEVAFQARESDEAYNNHVKLGLSKI